MTVELVVLDHRLHLWGLPTYQSAMAAAIDLHACLDDPLVHRAWHGPRPGARRVRHPHGRPEPRRPDPATRSGLGHRKGLVLGNLVGLVDPDYTGPIMVSAWNRNAAGTEPITLQPGERFAQLLFVPVARPVLQVVDRFLRPQRPRWRRVRLHRLSPHDSVT